MNRRDIIIPSKKPLPSFKALLAHTKASFDPKGAEIKALSEEIQGTPTQDQREKAKALFQELQTLCLEKGNCRPIRNFEAALSKHAVIREDLASELNQSSRSKAPSSCLWGTDSSLQTKLAHRTSLMGLFGILKTGHIAPRAGPNVRAVGDRKHVWTSINTIGHPIYGSYVLVLKNSALLEHSLQDVPDVGDHMGRQMEVVFRKSVEVSQNTLECIAVDPMATDVKELQKQCSKWAGWDIPVRDINEVREEMSKALKTCGVVVPKHWGRG